MWARACKEMRKSGWRGRAQWVHPGIAGRRKRGGSRNSGRACLAQRSAQVRDEVIRRGMAGRRLLSQANSPPAYQSSGLSNVSFMQVRQGGTGGCIVPQTARRGPRCLAAPA